MDMPRCNRFHHVRSSSRTWPYVAEQRAFQTAAPETQWAGTPPAGTIARVSGLNEAFATQPIPSAQTFGSAVTMRSALSRPYSGEA